MKVEESGEYRIWEMNDPKAHKIELEEGLYELKLEFIKPGLRIEWIEFKENIEEKERRLLLLLI